MKIRTKLFLSFLLLAVLAMSITLFQTIRSLSDRYRVMTANLAESSARQVESAFYENLGELVRKALFLSELREVVEGYDQPQDLDLALALKSFFFSHLNLLVLDREGNIMLSQQQASFSPLLAGGLANLPLLDPGRDPLLRDAGIFYNSSGFFMAAISPVIDLDSFDLAGFIVLELPFGREFLHQLKEKAKAEITLLRGESVLFSTVMESSEAELPDLPGQLLEASPYFQYQDARHTVSVFEFSDTGGTEQGKIILAVNVERILAAKKVNQINIILSSSLVFFLVLVLSLFLGGRLSRPLVELLQGVQSVSRGDLQVRVKPRNLDESGQLAVYFNEMTGALAAQRDRILELKHFFESIFANSPSALVILDESLSVVSLNPAAEKFFSRHNEAGLKGDNFFSRISSLQNLQEDCLKVLLGGQPLILENHLFHAPDGREIFLRLVIYQIKLHSGVFVVLQMEDVSEKLELETRLLHAKKMGLLGELLSRFSHEFNNLMTALLGQVALLAKDQQISAATRERIARIDEIAQRTNNLGRNMLDFSRKTKPQLARVDLLEATGAVLQLLEKTVLKNVSVNWQSGPGPFQIMADREKIMLAFFNLLLNARDAIAECGRQDGSIEIICERETNTELGETIVMKFSDNGCGIEENHLERIFEPYFSTKGDRGTGLGMITVKEVVEESGGRVSVSSEPGKGTSFKLYFGAAEA